MSEPFYMQKKQLLMEMKEETRGQLQAIQDEDIDGFVQRVEKCEKIIELINQIDQQAIRLSSAQEKEIQAIVEEIIFIREQIAPLLLPLKSKLQKLAVNERNKTLVQQGYEEGDWYQPSIFFDKKK